MTTPTASSGTLYIVATPIGNLQDMTLRALDVLRRVDLIAAEDTRNSGHLLQQHQIRTRLVALHEHNEKQASPKLIDALQSGQSVALISDAGTPGISDPGTYLVAAAHAAGIPVVPLPGPNAAVTALSAAGQAIPHFLFYGFLPPQPGARRHALEALATLPFPLVFYEAPHRIVETVQDLAGLLGGERTLTIARELTKVFETIRTLPLAAASDWLMADANRQRGEFVLIVSAPPPRARGAISDAARQALETLLAELPLKQAVSLAVKLTGEKKNDLYALALALQAEEG